VECVPGYDGGLPQRFVLEVYEARTMRLRLNLTSDAAPAFRVAELQPGSSTLLRMVLYAANPKGRGELTVLDDIALWDAEKRTGSRATQDWSAPLRQQNNSSRLFFFFLFLSSV
jgi:hypothetical protein